MLVHGEDMKEGDKERIMAGEVDIIFTSPEAGLSWIKMFSGDSFQKQCCLIAYDECHCVSEWGLDFRLKYRESASLASILDVPILCLTATITINIYKDIKKVLRLREPALIRVIPDRPEIHIQVIKPRSQFDDELTWMLDLIKNKKILCPRIIVFPPSIVYTARLFAWADDELGDMMYQNGSHKVEDRFNEMFHAGMDLPVKDRIMSGFSQKGGCIRLLFATVAFGMGVSVDHIEVVIHWGCQGHVYHCGKK